MHLRRKNNKATAESFKSFNQLGEYIQIIIDVYSSSEINRRLWLTEREKEFFIATVIHVILGYVNPISDEAVQIYKKHFNPDTNKIKISDYINRVRKKGWLKYDKKNRTVQIPQIFDDIGIGTDTVTFNLRFTYESIDRSDTD